MKKKLFVLSVISLVFVALMFVVWFIPLTDKDLFDLPFSLFGFLVVTIEAPLEIILSSFVTILIYDILNVVFGVLIVIHCIKNIKFAKSNDEVVEGKKFATKAVGVMVVFAVLGWIAAFLVLGQGKGDVPGIIKALIVFLVPSITLTVLNGQLKKLQPKTVKKEVNK